MQKKIVKEEIDNILKYEKEKIFDDGLLKNEEEVVAYLEIIKREMELVWTYDNYIRYWKSVFSNKRFKN